MLTINTLIVTGEDDGSSALGAAPWLCVSLSWTNLHLYPSKTKCLTVFSITQVLSANYQALTVVSEICEDFPDGPVVKDPSANVGDTGSILVPGRFHILQSN